MEINKWEDKTYHAMECMRELQAAEIHLIQYTKNKEKSPVIQDLLEKIRTFRKTVERNTL